MKVKKRKNFADILMLILSFLYCYNTINQNKLKIKNNNK